MSPGGKIHIILYGTKVTNEEVCRNSQLRIIVNGMLGCRYTVEVYAHLLF